MKGNSLTLSKVILAAFVGLFSSCTQSTHLNSPQISPFDTTRYGFARLVVHGLPGVENAQSILDWCNPAYSIVHDTVFQTEIQKTDSLRGIPCRFIKDTLTIQDQLHTDTDSIAWCFRLVLDSTRTRIKSATYSRQSDRWDFIFDKWWTSTSDTAFDLPFTVKSDGSLVAHLPSCRVGCSSDSMDYSDYKGCHQITSRANSIGIAGSDSYIDLEISPR